jgi:hypothetical protein
MLRVAVGLLRVWNPMKVSIQGSHTRLASAVSSLPKVRRYGNRKRSNPRPLRRSVPATSVPGGARRSLTLWPSESLASGGQHQLFTSLHSSQAQLVQRSWAQAAQGAFYILHKHRTLSALGNTTYTGCSVHAHTMTNTHHFDVDACA